ncbi:MAG: alpha/beta hydrolase [Chitinophagales bacterium]|nr:alpha/beta hydrolase [Chitinophagales bacterium]
MQTALYTRRWGNGPHLLLAFHGFADTGAMYAPLEKIIGDQYTILAPDLPFHGQTQWPKADFNQEDLLEWINAVCTTEGKTRFSLMGYSFGARLALALAPRLEQQLEKLYLLAPEGLGTQGMGLAQRTPMWLRRAFRTLFPAALGLAKSGLLPGSIARFLRANLSTRARVARTFACWYSMRHFPVFMDKSKAFLGKSRIFTCIVAGKNDPLMNQPALHRFAEGGPNIRLFLPEAGHRLDLTELAPVFTAPFEI